MNKFTTQKDGTKIILNKSFIFKDCITTNELLAALKDESFKDTDERVQIHSPFADQFLTLVYECNECENLHLASGHELIIPALEHQKKIHINYAQNIKNRPAVRRKELIEFLSGFKRNVKVIISTISVFEVGATLTRVIKCSDGCNGAHLDCQYNSDTFQQN